MLIDTPQLANIGSLYLRNDTVAIKTENFFSTVVPKKLEITLAPKHYPLEKILSLIDAQGGKECELKLYTDVLRGQLSIEKLPFVNTYNGELWHNTDDPLEEEEKKIITSLFDISYQERNGKQEMKIGNPSIEAQKGAYRWAYRRGFRIDFCSGKQQQLHLHERNDNTVDIAITRIGMAPAKRWIGRLITKHMGADFTDPMIAKIEKSLRALDVQLAGEWQLEQYTIPTVQEAMNALR